ncbi:DUF4279 domain-containing protein [Kribbella sp. NPDC051952]|uniref:DUF4279 domain-containing protein n=1 Tax=Kribbella sp. NPDC051952 TaxID=3154851 RepID=UPI003423C373
MNYRVTAAASMAGVIRTPRVEQRAELRVYASDTGEDFDPESLTSLLGIIPSKVMRRGDVLRSGRVRDVTVWWWETPERVEWDSEALVLEVLDAFEPVAEQLAEAVRRWGLTLVIGLVTSMYGVIQADSDNEIGLDVATPALAFSAETLRRLGRLGASIDVDLYVIAPE